MSLIDEIVYPPNMEEAIGRVMKNKGAPGVDRMSVEELPKWWETEGLSTISLIRTMKYKPQPVKRVYIPKPNGKKRPLGIPTASDRVVQQAAAQVLNRIFDPTFSDSSFGFRENRSAHDAVNQALEYLNNGYEWVIDLDIQQFFDKVNHDKLISIIREKVNDKQTLHLIRSFLKADVMSEGNIERNDIGTPQGGCISPLLANIYLDKFDKELETRGLKFCRYADDVVIFAKSEMAANRIMNSVSNWLERNLFLTTSPEKTHVCRPSKSQFLGFTFWKGKKGWQPKPDNARKMRLYDKLRQVLCRKKAAARTIGQTIAKCNQIIRGWINYFRMGTMKTFMKEFGQWLRHKVRVVILKQWKRPKTIYRELTNLNAQLRAGFTPEDIRQTANSRLGWYRTAGWKTVNFLLPPKFLAQRDKNRPGLIDPLEYYQKPCNS